MEFFGKWIEKAIEWISQKLFSHFSDAWGELTAPQKTIAKYLFGWSLMITIVLIGGTIYLTCSIREKLITKEMEGYGVSIETKDSVKALHFDYRYPRYMQNKIFFVNPAMGWQ